MVKICLMDSLKFTLETNKINVKDIVNKIVSLVEEKASNL